jgi:hypothetical protein
MACQEAKSHAGLLFFLGANPKDGQNGSMEQNPQTATGQAQGVQKTAFELLVEVVGPERASELAGKVESIAELEAQKAHLDSCRARGHIMDDYECSGKDFDCLSENCPDLPEEAREESRLVERQRRELDFVIERLQERFPKLKGAYQNTQTTTERPPSPVTKL